MGLQVGQKLWYVPSQRGEPCEVSVTSVGRKWATLAPFYKGRIDKETLVADGCGYSSPGRCYESREDYQEAAKLSASWSEFQRIISRTYAPPKGLTVEDIRYAKETLQLSKKGE